MSEADVVVVVVVNSKSSMPGCLAITNWLVLKVTGQFIDLVTGVGFTPSAELLTPTAVTLAGKAL